MAGFTPVRIDDLKLEDDCVETLKAIGEKLRGGQQGAVLLLWYPLLSIAASPTPGDVIITLRETDWESLVPTVAGLNKIVLLSVSNDCAIESAKHNSNTKLKKVWNALYEFYRDRAESA